MKLQVIIAVVLCLVEINYAQNWSLGGKVNTDGKVTLNLSHHVGKWQFFAGGSVSGGKVGGEVGFKVKLKRSIQKPLFKIYIEASPCYFEFYDKNQDGVITMREMLTLFRYNTSLGGRLYNVLNSDKGNNFITQEEFYKNSKDFIEGCNNQM